MCNAPLKKRLISVSKPGTDLFFLFDSNHTDMSRVTVVGTLLPPPPGNLEEVTNHSVHLHHHICRQLRQQPVAKKQFRISRSHCRTELHCRQRTKAFPQPPPSSGPSCWQSESSARRSAERPLSAGPDT